MNTADGHTLGNGLPQQLANGLTSTVNGLAKAATADGTKERIQIIDDQKQFTFVLPDRCLGLARDSCAI